MKLPKKFQKTFFLPKSEKYSAANVFLYLEQNIFKLSAFVKKCINE